MKTLILFAHPAFHKSTVNKILIKDLDKLHDVTFHDLYEVYPDFDIDVKKEQALLTQHDCIIFHFPLFWFSTPSLLKEWQDLVLEHGWAFGSKGNMLKNKLFIISITTGGQKSSYVGAENHHYTINQLLTPLYQTSRLCKMRCTPPFVVYGTLGIEKPEILEYKRIYSELIRQITKGEFNIDNAKKYENLNDCITHKSL